MTMAVALRSISHWDPESPESQKKKKMTKRQKKRIALFTLLGVIVTVLIFFVLWSPQQHSDKLHTLEAKPDQKAQDPDRFETG
jgi:hypothetical protein